MKVKVKIGVPDWCLDEYSDYIEEVKESTKKEYAKRFSDHGVAPKDISVESIATDGEFYTKVEVEDGDDDGILGLFHDADGISEGEENPCRRTETEPVIAEKGECVEPYDGLPIDMGPLIDAQSEVAPRSLTRFEQVLAMVKLWAMLEYRCDEELHTEQGTFILDTAEKAYIKGVIAETTGIEGQIKRLKEYVSKW